MEFWFHRQLPAEDWQNRSAMGTPAAALPSHIAVIPFVGLAFSTTCYACTNPDCLARWFARPEILLPQNLRPAFYLGHTPMLRHFICTMRAHRKSQSTVDSDSFVIAFQTTSTLFVRQGTGDQPGRHSTSCVIHTHRH